MESKAVDGGWLVRFAHGEDIVAGLLGFARERNIEGAWVNMLGAIEDPELGYYHLDTQDVHAAHVPRRLGDHGDRRQPGVARRHPVLHVHATIGGPDFSTRGGHLFAGRAGATCEVFVRDLGTRISRAPDPDIGLALWSLER